ncbi:uncharacterized protein DNG_02889 [Cephalotrichum gorgonifer]|uniref:Protein YAE1 n=1 Tax=Cephalotrichum gorgonifer TaxID=2041049 RepID=A0AAE8MUC6_9PEZI|nr:uncharacterized protein DNG_02889 [Cephalotrichum gorgonifer]
MEAGYHPPPARTTLDDVFGDDPVADGQAHATPRVHSISSDLPQLEREHVTTGYRDGVTAAKAGSVQAGFDEGFSLGAEIGKRVGEILGILEGIYEATGADAEVVERAREEMSSEKVFGQEYWCGDGTWKFEVEAGGERGREDIIFADVADAHPLVQIWSAIVDEQVKRWGVDVGVLESSTETAEDLAPREDVEASTKPVAETKKTVLDW